MPTYADVILPIATPAPYTYRIAEGQSLQVGIRVVVPLGKSKRYIGIVASIHDMAPAKGTAREISQVVDLKPIVTPRQIELWRWVAKYYMAPLGEVMKVAIPAALRDNSFSPPSFRAFRLSVEIRTQEQLHRLLESLKRAPAQQKALLSYMEVAEDEVGEGWLESPPAIAKTWFEAREDISYDSVLKLYKRGVLESLEIPEDRWSKSHPVEIYAEERSAVFDSLEQEFLRFDTVLLFEKQPFEKSQLYLELIEKESHVQGTVLILQPDIFSATELEKRLRPALGDSLLMYHSRMSDSARSKAYMRSVNNPSSVRVVVGTRSALFLNFENLRLVVVEQEHDFSYKSDSAPRFNGRDAAIVLASIHKVKSLMTSEVPTLESYYNCKSGRWGSVTVDGHMARAEFKVLERGKGLLSTYLRKRISEVIDQGNQVLIFQNRRGFASYIECSDCFHTPGCRSCNVTLTYHKTDNMLRCHYCGYSEPYPAVCGACGSVRVKEHGVGTQRIEESLSELFPDVAIARLDYDTTRRSGAFGEIASKFETGDSSIIVGTQLITKGIDFSNVALVAIANADNMFSAPDFRSSERAFRLLTMMSNRVGVSGAEVVIQTSQRTNPVITKVTAGDHIGFYEMELAQRRELFYPPTVRMALFSLRHIDRTVLFRAAERFDSLLRPVFGNRLSPAYEPQIERTHGLYILEVMLRIERNRSFEKAKEIALTAVESLRQGFSTLIIYADVDPL